jgi:hypothetical protein
METHSHDMPSLFAQLGLPSGDADIQNFIAEHRLVDSTTKLFDASFWSDSQAKFLRDQLKVDADWAVVIDSLDTSLRQ